VRRASRVNPISETVPSPAPAPPRPARVAALRSLMGRPDDSVRPFADAIRAVSRRSFDRHVMPLVRAHWPSMVGTAFAEKLRIGACDLYASGPYTAFFCAPDRPPLVRAVTAVGDALPLPPWALARLAGVTVRALGRLAYADQHRRIALVAAFIVVVDHALDHVMTDAPAERGARLSAVLEGEAPPDHPCLALARALRVAMAQDLDPRDQRAFAAAMTQVYGWVDAEVRAMRGEPDPEGLGHRRAGVEGTIDGLLFPVVRFGARGARPWMIDVSMFVQLMDDWLDVDDDARSDRDTPMVTGAWTFADVARGWRDTLAGVESLARSAGMRSPRYHHFLREAYALMMVDVMEAMAERPDA
jgi:hypothetical protein